MTRHAATVRTAPSGLRGLVWPGAALLLLLLANLLVNPRFFRIHVADGRLAGSPIDVLERAAPLAIVAAGMTPVIATAGVDLSVGAVMAIAGSLAALLAQHQLPALPVAGLVLGVAAAAGLWNGLLVVGLRVQPIVATLVLMVAGRGAAQLLTDGQIIPIERPELLLLGSGHLLGLPLAAVLAAASYLLAALLARGTALGLFIEAAGGNETAARLSGVPVGAVKLAAYAAAGAGAGLAGLIVAADIRAADANNAGLYMELDAILAVVIGGTVLTGGRFSLVGSLLGALVIQTLTTTILTAGVPVEFTLVVKALVVLAVCALQSEGFRAAAARFRKSR